MFCVGRMWTGKSDEFVDRASAGTEARQHRALSDRGTSSADDCAVGRDGNAVARTVSFRRIQYRVDCCNSTRSHVYTRSDNLSGLIGQNCVTSVPLAVRLSWLKMPIHAHLLRQVILTRKVCPTDLVFGV